MVLYNDGNFVTNSSFPDTDFMGDADFVIPDDTEIAEKVRRLYPYAKIVTDDSGGIVDVVEIEHDVTEKLPEITLEQRVTATENAVEELISMIMGG